MKRREEQRRSKADNSTPMKTIKARAAHKAEVQRRTAHQQPKDDEHRNSVLTSFQLLLFGLVVTAVCGTAALVRTLHDDRWGEFLFLLQECLRRCFL